MNSELIYLTSITFVPLALLASKRLKSLFSQEGRQNGHMDLLPRYSPQVKRFLPFVRFLLIAAAAVILRSKTPLRLPGCGREASGRGKG